MKVLTLNHAEVEQLLPMAECITVMEEVLAGLARGELVQPLRMIVNPQDSSGVMAMMPAYRSGAHSVYGLKAICVFPGNPARGLDAHQGGVLLFSGETGELMALINASAITAIRTAAVSAVATRLLAREDAGELAIIGAGVQARTHLEAMAKVRPIKRARVTSRNSEHAGQLVREVQPRFSFPIEAVADAHTAIAGADLIVTATTSRDPVVQRDWIAPGAHVNAIGTFSRSAREIDTATMASVSLFVDRRESALNEAGDYLIAAREGAIGPENIRAEIGELLIGAACGRQHEDEITLFKSLGLAVEDLAAASYLYDQAQRRSAGTQVDFA